MAEILSLVLKRHLNLSELIMHLSGHFPWGCLWGAPQTPPRKEALVQPSVT